MRGVALTLLAVLLLGGVAHGVGWMWLTAAMTVGFSDWVAQQRARGWEVEHGLPKRGGWPFAARLTVPGVRIAGWTAALPQGFVWEAGQVDLSIAPPRINQMMMAASGPQLLRTSAFSVPYTAARLEARVPLDNAPPGPPPPGLPPHGPPPGPPPVGMEFTIEALRADTRDGPLTIGQLHARLAPGRENGEPALILRLDTRQVGLPPLPQLTALGREVESASMDAVLVGPPTLPLPLTPRDRVENFRDNASRLELRSLALRWGPLASDLRMVLRLDAALQPVGSGVLRLERPVEMVAALAETGVIPPRSAMTAGAVLGMVARAPEAGGAPQVEVPVGIADGTITLASIPLLRLRPIVWPGEALHLR